MPICKIYYSEKKVLSETALSEIEKIILSGLAAEGEQAQVCGIPNVALNRGEVYIELLCRNKANRTLEKLHLLAVNLENLLSQLLETTKPIKVRIIKIEEDLLAGIN